MSLTENAIFVWIIGIVVLVLYFIREVVKLRIQLNKLDSDRISTKIQGVMTALKVLGDLQDKGIDDDEVRAIKSYLLREIGVESASSASTAPSQSEIESRGKRGKLNSWLVSCTANVEERTAGAAFGVFIMFMMGPLILLMGASMSYLASEALSYLNLYFMNNFISGNFLLMALCIFGFLSLAVTWVFLGATPLVLGVCFILGGSILIITAAFPALSRRKMMARIDQLLPKWE